MSRKHGFVSFTDRVAAIRIDPIRKREGNRNAPDSDTDSLFISGLQRWNDLNMASHYTKFSSECTHLVKSLPMVLYNQEKIFNLLERYTIETDEYSAQPLLDLIVQFARDLGEDFEPFYPRTLDVCVNLIKKFQKDDQKLDIIEHSFNCLAHLFKYLSRLLTPNLVPTYEVLAPLYGADKQSKMRQYVLRFAAESMGFLIRRARDQSLDLIVDHIVQRAANDEQNMQFLNSSSQLFAATMKSSGTSLHSKTSGLLHAYIKSCHKYKMINLIDSVLVDVLHHARKDTAKPVYDVCLTFINENLDEFSANLLFVVSGFRKGDRVPNWNSIYESLNKLAPVCNDSLSWLLALASALSFADLGASSRNLKPLLDTVPSYAKLVGLLEILSEHQPEICKAFKPAFDKAIDAKAASTRETSTQLGVQLSGLLYNDTDFKPLTGGEAKLHSRDFQGLRDLWWQLKSFNLIRNASSLLNELLDLTFDDQSYESLKSVTVADILAKSDEIESPQLKKCAESLVFTPQLMRSLFSKPSFFDQDEDDQDKDHVFETAKSKIETCLLSSDRNVRSGALFAAKKVFPVMDEVQFLLDEASVINDLPFDIENSRNISHRLRQLGNKFTLSTQKHEKVSKMIISFYFGMLCSRFLPVVKGVLEVLPKLSESCPQLVCQLALFLIEHNQPMFKELTMSVDGSGSVPQSVFGIDCHTLFAFEEDAVSVMTSIDNLEQTIEKRAAKEVKFDFNSEIRIQGIKALTTVPEGTESQNDVIEKLVPYVLKVNTDDEEDSTTEDVVNGVNQYKLSFNETLAILELFSKFKTPGKLSKFTELKAKYLYFLGSQHLPLQRLGLKCLLTCNSKEIRTLRKYRENFDALLDDKRFRDELTSFICVGDDLMSEGSLHQDDYPVILEFVVRVLYGRALSGNKRNMRHAVMSSLHFLKPDFLLKFIDLAHAHLIESKVLDAGVDFNDHSITKRVLGYLSLVNDFTKSLQSASMACIPTILENGIIPILERINLKDSKTLRQAITKNLTEMLTSVPVYSIWSQYFPAIHDYLVKPQMTDNFGLVNLEHPSTIMRLYLSLSGEKELAPLIDPEFVIKMVSCLEYERVNESVIQIILQLTINLVENGPTLDATNTAVPMVLQLLPRQMEREKDRELSSECLAMTVQCLNSIFSLGVEKFSAKTVNDFASVSFRALSQPSRLVSLQVKASILQALSKLLSSPSASIDLINNAYHILAPLFRQFVARDARLHLCACYRVFALKNSEYERVARLITELNSFDVHRLGEPDFTRRSAAFEEINEGCYKELSELEWEPLMFNMMFFIKDPEELALRNNGRYSLLRMIESQNAVQLVKDHLLEGIKRGLRIPEEKFRRNYIDLLAQCVRFDLFPKLKVLLFNGDEEADFFVNVNHIQVHRRRRAIQRLGKLTSDIDVELDENDIAHYLLAIVENFALLSGNKNGELNNLADDALQSIPLLLQRVSSGQYRSIAKRWVKNTTLEPEPHKLRKNVRIVTAVAQAAPSKPGNDEFVSRALIQPLHEMLTLKSNEHENLPDRIPLSVTIIYFLMSLEPAKIELQLPGKLTTLCQLLRSKIQEMRDTVRQTLGKIAKILGCKYLSFIMFELYGALRKGGVKSHVLGYTVHSLLVEVQRGGEMKVGDLDDCAAVVFQVIINDTFGYVGEEKDDEGYVTQAKEVKQHKSYDSAEILARWTSLSQYGKIINPLRQYLVINKINLKTERKIEELLRKIATGLHHNPESQTQDAVVMSYEVFKLCQNILDSIHEKTDMQNNSTISGSLQARIDAAKESEQFFKVRLSAKDWYASQDTSAQVDVSVKYANSNLHLLQAFAIDCLRSVMTSTAGGGTGASGKGLLNISNVKGIMPLVVSGLQSNFEDLQIASLRLATTALRLPVQFSENDDTIQLCGLRALEFIESNPETTTTICQVSLKFLTMLIRTRSDFELDDKSISYLLERVLPDIDEPERQSAVISFVRCLFSRMVLLPQIYSIADKLAEVLVRNQNEATRVNCRHAYLQFLSSYPLGQSRLDRHLANLAANLRYAAPDGRLSVMEMIHLLLERVGVDQLQSAFIPFFANLVLLLVTDTEPECRKRAAPLIKLLIEKASPATRATMIEHCNNWLKAFGKNNMLARGGLEVVTMFDELPKDVQVLHSQIVTEILKSGSRNSDTTDEAEGEREQFDWQLLYLALDANLSDHMHLVESILLFPHPWVRNKATRVFNSYFKTLTNPDEAIDLLKNSTRKFVRQLGAPRLTAEDSLNIVKNVVYLARILEDKGCKTDSDELYVDWIVRKLCSNIRTNIGSAELVGGKTGSVQIIAAIPSVLKRETVSRLSYEIIRSVYVMVEQLTMEDAHEELRDLGNETLGVYESALGTTEYFQTYTRAKQFVHDKRLERRSKRSIEQVTNPEFAARKRMKKNLHKRDVRKQKKH